MFVIWCVLSLVTVCYADQLPVISRFESNEFVETMKLPKIFPTIDPSILEDVNLTTPQLITKYGYKAELHYVTTEDGYILELHRITGKQNSIEMGKKAVCLLQHGLFGTSASWILTGPSHALGYRLSDEGYDVWLANSRGSYYGCNHTRYHPFGKSDDRKHFWSFSFHEMGVFDLPAVIDYILMQTNEKKLQYIAHSQGTAAFFILTSQKPEYNQKIIMMHALAPVAFMSHVISPPIRAIAPFIFSAQKVMSLLGINYVAPTDEFFTMAEEKLCRDKVPTQIICKNLMFLMMGYTSDQLNTTLLPLLIGYPAGSSIDQLLHFGQEVKSGHFRQFDHGHAGNIIHYKRPTPPDYNLSNIKAAVGLYYAQDDWLSDVRDVDRLKTSLSNVINDYLVPHEKFNHLDFISGIDAEHLVYDEVVKTMQSGEFMSLNQVDNDVDISRL